MTSMVYRTGIDSKGPASIYLASDNRITWSRHFNLGSGEESFRVSHWRSHQCNESRNCPARVTAALAPWLMPLPPGHYTGGEFRLLVAPMSRGKLCNSSASSRQSMGSSPLSKALT